MARLQQIILCGLLVLTGGRLGAASHAESNLYRAATNSFAIGFWNRAEKELAQFVEKFPRSEWRAEVILMQGEARYQQTNSDGVIALLAANLERAEGLADQYRFWIAEAQFQKGDFAAAATAYAELLNLHAVSGRKLESLVGEAAARSRLGQWTQVVALLGAPDGELTRALAASPANEIAMRGFLLLAEAHLANKNYSGAETALAPLAAKKFAPALDWRAEYLRAAAQRAGGKLTEAMATSSNLVALAGLATSGRARLLAESISLQAGIREQLGQPDEAVAALRRNLTPDAPEEQQRDALLKITELLGAQGKTAEAVAILEQFLNQHTNAPAADVAWLTLGELQLRQPVGAATNTSPMNQRPLALAAFDRLIKEFPNSAFVGKAELDRGWCFWVVNQMAESATAFARAVARLPDSEDLAIARFKLGDALFAQNDFAGARDNYRAALTAFPRWPRLDAALRGQALYQISRVCGELKDRAGAEDAMRQILALPAGRNLAERSVLLVGQNDLDAGEPANALRVFETFVDLVPDSSLRPEVELLIARAHEQLADWPGAVTNYERWLERFASNALQPQAEFQLALASFQAGNDTNALRLLTNFVARFATNSLAAQAQWWIADYYHRLGESESLNAEKNYKTLFQGWPASSLAYEARMMAGRVAVGRQGYKEAIEYFTSLTSDLKCPPGLKAQALFAYGDTLMSLPAETNRLANYQEAILVFNKLQQEYPTNELALLAWIEIAKCHRQMGSSGASNAVFAFSQVLTHPLAGVAARSEAEVGLGMVLEEQAQSLEGAEQAAMLKSARDHYLNVVFEENLRPGEMRDDFWVKEAGLKAGRVTEAVGEWPQAVKLYERMQVLLPSLRATWQSKRDAAQKHLSPEKS